MGVIPEQDQETEEPVSAFRMDRTGDQVTSSPHDFPDFPPAPLLLLPLLSPLPPPASAHDGREVISHARVRQSQNRKAPAKFHKTLSRTRWSPLLAETLLIEGLF